MYTSSFWNRPKSNPAPASGAPRPRARRAPIISPSRGGDHGLPRPHPARRRRLGGVPARRDPRRAPLGVDPGRGAHGSGRRGRRRTSVLTAHYLVLGASRVEVVGLDGRPRPVARISLDHDSGLALLTVEGAGFEPARLVGEEELRPGDPVFMLTCTGDKERRGASGHVSFVGPFEAFWEYMLDRAIMTTIVNPGLAGGPLLDGRGRVAGIVSLGLAAVGRYSLAIPTALFRERRARLESGRARPRVGAPRLDRLLPAGDRRRHRRLGRRARRAGRLGRPPAGRPARERGRPVGPGPAPALPRAVAQGPGRDRRDAGPARGVASTSSRSWRATATSSTSRSPCPS